jgi:hypothetical protein
LEKVKGIVLRILDQLTQYEHILQESMEELDGQQYEDIKETLLDCAQLTARQIRLLTQLRRELP